MYCPSKPSCQESPFVLFFLHRKLRFSIFRSWQPCVLCIIPGSESAQETEQTPGLHRGCGSCNSLHLHIRLTNSDFVMVSKASCGRQTQEMRKTVKRLEAHNEAWAGSSEREPDPVPAHSKKTRRAFQQTRCHGISQELKHCFKEGFCIWTLIDSTDSVETGVKEMWIMVAP